MIRSAPARRIAVRFSRTTVLRSQRPSRAASFTIAYSPLTLQARRERQLREERERRVVAHLAALAEDPAVPVVGVRAEADVGHDEQVVAEAPLERPDGAGDERLALVRRPPRVVLPLGRLDAEEEDL